VRLAGVVAQLVSQSAGAVVVRAGATNNAHSGSVEIDTAAGATLRYEGGYTYNARTF
jgi:hypothetical protein